MRFFILFIALFLFLESCQTSSEKDCKYFRSGKFYYKPRGTKDIWIIERTDTIQTESLKNGSMKSEWKIQWKNDCEYNLISFEDSDNTKVNQFGLSKTIEIIKSTSDYYIFKDKSTKATDTIWTSL